MFKSNKNGYRIIIVNEDGQNSKTIKLTRLTMNLIKLGVVLLIVGIIAMAMYWGDFVVLNKRADNLEKELNKRETQITQIDHIEGRLKEMDKYLSYIKYAVTLTGQEVPVTLSDFIGNDSLTKSYESKERKYTNLPNIIPVSGSWISRKYKPSEKHWGIDYVAVEGSVIRSPANGVVIKVYVDKELGNILEIDNSNGISTLFAHCKEIIVKANDQVIKGETIATVGNSGISSSGPHLHYEIHKDGKPVDPSNYIIKGL